MPDFDETLLSAYLDGELPPDECARVEQWLVDQPESRQLLEELRSIKTGLQRLPRDRLPHDFAAKVLRQAEREILTCSDEDQPARGVSWKRLRRPLAWAALTLAAGLLLMVFDRQQQQRAAQRQVALAPQEAPAARPAIGAPAGEAGRDEKALYDEAPRDAAAPAPAADSAMRLATAPAEESGQSGDEPLGLVSEQALVVWCEVAPDSRYNERFRELLGSNSIAWSDRREEQAAGGLSRSAPSQDANAAFFGQPTPSPNERRLREARQAALQADAELVLVEAGESQIEAVLAELDRDADVFKAVDVEPAADAPRQQQFSQYRRGTILGRELAQRKSGLSQKKQPADKDEADRVPPKPVAKAAKQNSQPGIAYRLRAGGSAAPPALQAERLDEAKRELAEAGGDRLQVLFVLRPRDAAKPPSASAQEKPSEQD